MKFLIDEDLPRSIGYLLRSYGHEAIDIRDIGMRGAKDSQIADYSLKYDCCIITGDYDFSDIRNYPPSKYKGIVVLSIPANTTTSYIYNLVENFLRSERLVSQIPGRLTIVEPGRVRVRKG